MNQPNFEIVNIDVSNDVISLWEIDDESKYSKLIKELDNSFKKKPFLGNFKELSGER